MVKNVCVVHIMIVNVLFILLVITVHSVPTKEAYGRCLIINITQARLSIQAVISLRSIAAWPPAARNLVSDKYVDQ